MLIKILICLVYIIYQADAQNRKTNIQSDFNSFSNLFNHNLWTFNGSLDISSNCASDVKEYLSDLKNLKLWALQVNQASARSSGQFLMEKDFWMGSPELCKILNYEYFMAHVLLRVNLFKDQSRHLQIGQCLPKTCLINDVLKLLNADQAGQILRESSKLNKFQVEKVRKVPGDLDLMKDARFLFFM